MKFYNLNAAQLAAELETDISNGLDEAQAGERIAKDGHNFQTVGKPRRGSRVFLLPIALAAVIYSAAALFTKNAMLLVNAALCLILPLLSFSLLSLLCRAVEKRFDGLSPLGFGRVTVIRGGIEQSLPYSDITYGDIVLFKKGDYIPFDARILESNLLETDESTVCGKKNVPKRAGVITEDNVDISKQYNMLFCSSYIVSGTAKAVVTDISDRVYIRRSGKKHADTHRTAAKLTDFSRLFMLLLAAIAAVFTLACCIFTGDIVSALVSIMLIFSAYTSDAVARFIRLSTELFYIRCERAGIYLRSLSVTDALNDAEIMLVRHNEIYGVNADISGFVTEKGEFKHTSEIGKDNFSVFLYAMFSGGDVPKGSPYYSFRKKTARLLKSIGIDFSDVRSMSPVISSGVGAYGTNACGIVQSGSNVVIVSGSVAHVLKMCSGGRAERYHTALEQLRHISSEIIAVAVKPEEVIGEDMSVYTDGFRLVGFIGLKREPDSSVRRTLSALVKSGAHVAVLYPDQEEYARLAGFPEKTRYGMYADVVSGAADITESDVLCGFDGNMDRLIEVCRGRHLVFKGSKPENDMKTVAVGEYDASMYDNKDSDIVCDGSALSVAKAVTNAKSIYAEIMSLLENIIVLTVIFSISSLVFAIIKGSPLLPPLGVIALLFIALPFCTLLSVFGGRRKSLSSSAALSRQPLQKELVVFSLCSSAVFTLLTVLCALMLSAKTASYLLVAAFTAFLPLCAAEAAKPTRKGAVIMAASYIPAVAAIIASAVSNGGLGFLYGLVAAVLGAAVKYVCRMISRLVK